MAHATSHGRRIGLPACVAVKTFLRSAVELAMLGSETTCGSETAASKLMAHMKRMYEYS